MVWSFVELDIEDGVSSMSASKKQTRSEMHSHFQKFILHVDTVVSSPFLGEFICSGHHRTIVLAARVQNHGRVKGFRCLQLPLVAAG